jgi:hypothetical protein
MAEEYDYRVIYLKGQRPLLRERDTSRIAVPARDSGSPPGAPRPDAADQGIRYDISK